MMLGSSTWAAVLVSTRESQKTKLSGYPQRKLEIVLVKTSGTAVSVYMYSAIFIGTTETAVLL